MAIEEKDRDDVMDRLLQLGGDKKFLSYDDLNRELPENVVSPDDIEDVLQKLDASNIHVADSDERLIEQAAAIATDDEEGEDDLELEPDCNECVGEIVENGRRNQRQRDIAQTLPKRRAIDLGGVQMILWDVQQGGQKDHHRSSDVPNTPQDDRGLAPIRARQPAGRMLDSQSNE